MRRILGFLGRSRSPVTPDPLQSMEIPSIQNRPSDFRELVCQDRTIPPGPQVEDMVIDGRSICWERTGYRYDVWADEVWVGTIWRADHQSVWKFSISAELGGHQVQAWGFDDVLVTGLREHVWPSSDPTLNVPVMDGNTIQYERTGPNGFAVYLDGSLVGRLSRAGSGWAFTLTEDLGGATYTGGYWKALVFTSLGRAIGGGL